MGLLIDASILIEAERGQIDIERRIAGREDEPFYLSVVSASELLHGVHRAGDEGIRARRSAFVESLLASLPLLEIDLPTARAHARLWADLAAKGQLIGAHDMWLAATCLAQGLRIATGNLREFDRVEGLNVEIWTD